MYPYAPYYTRKSASDPEVDYRLTLGLRARKAGAKFLDIGCEELPEQTGRDGRQARSRPNEALMWHRWAPWRDGPVAGPPDILSGWSEGLLRLMAYISMSFLALGTTFLRVM